MRKVISIYGDKEHIISANEKYVFFKFPDGKEDHIKSRKQDMMDVLKWIHTEMYFYHRMYIEVKDMYESEKEEFDRTRHYYSDEEIHAACLKNRFANINMGLSNEQYKKDWDRIAGKWNIASMANDKYWKLYRIAEQIQRAIKVM